MLTRLLLLLVLFAFGCGHAGAQSLPGIPGTVTHLVVSNKRSNDVTIALTLQSPGPIVQDGCSLNINDYRVMDLTPGSNFPVSSFTTYDGFGTSKGLFTLEQGHRYEIFSTKANPNPTQGAPGQQNCLQGVVITFDQFGACPAVKPNTPAFPVPFVPGPDIPNGVTQCEATLNVPHTINGAPGGGSHEGTNISCVNGANTIIELKITNNTGAQNWTYEASGTITPGQSFATRNSWVNVARKCDDNCFQIVNGVKTSRPGVFPYGCTQCNILPDPAPPCGQFCAANNGLPPNTGCLFDRVPQTSLPVTQQFGGTVEFTYLSKANAGNCNSKALGRGKR